MKHLAAYLLLSLGGNNSPSAKDIKKLLDSVGIEADDERLDKLISELDGKDLQEVLKSTLVLFYMACSCYNSWSARALASLPLFHLVVLAVRLQQLVVQQQLTVLPRRRNQPRKKRKRYIYSFYCHQVWVLQEFFLGVGRRYGLRSLWLESQICSSGAPLYYRIWLEIHDEKQEGCAGSISSI